LFNFSFFLSFKNASFCAGKFKDFNLNFCAKVPEMCCAKVTLPKVRKSDLMARRFRWATACHKCLNQINAGIREGDSFFSSRRRTTRWQELKLCKTLGVVLTMAANQDNYPGGQEIRREIGEDNGQNSRLLQVVIVSA